MNIELVKEFLDEDCKVAVAYWNKETNQEEIAKGQVVGINLDEDIITVEGVNLAGKRFIKDIHSSNLNSVTEIGEEIETTGEEITNTLTGKVQDFKLDIPKPKKLKIEKYTIVKSK